VVASRNFWSKPDTPRVQNKNRDESLTTAIQKGRQKKNKGGTIMWASYVAPSVCFGEQKKTEREKRNRAARTAMAERDPGSWP